IRRRSCEQIWPFRLNTTGFTHIVLGFAVFDPKNFTVSMEHPDDGEIYKQFLHLPDNVRKGLAIGGWEVSNEGPTRTAWSDMSSTKSNRKAFVDSLKQFLDTWNFTGIEIHWEWPGASNRGGNPADTQNQVDLVHELRECLGKDFTISVVLPAQKEYLKNMAPLKMQNFVDWFTVLTYDLHGPWDAFINSLGPKIKPHTDLAEINTALDLLTSASLDPAKVNMGIANYGRGFTVANQTCKYYGCEFTGPSKAGSCTREDGLLSACEISRIIREKNLTPQVIYGGAGVKEISWADQWIGYDDNATLAMKLALANKRCLGGTSLWAIEHEYCDGGSGGPHAPPPTQPSLLPSAPVPHPAPSGAPSPVQPGILSSAPPGSSSRPAPPSIQSSIQSGMPSSAPSPVQPSLPSSAPPFPCSDPVLAPSASSFIQPALPSSVQPGLPSSSSPGSSARPGLPSSVQPSLPSSSASRIPSPAQPGIPSSASPGSSASPSLPSSTPTVSVNPAPSSLPSSIASTQGPIVPQPPKSSIGPNHPSVVPSVSEHPSSQGSPTPSSAVSSSQPISGSTLSHSDVFSSVQIPGPISPSPSRSASPAPSSAPTPSFGVTSVASVSASSSSRSGSSATESSVTAIIPIVPSVTNIVPPVSSAPVSSAVWPGSSTGPSATAIVPVVPILPSGATSLATPTTQVGSSPAVGSSWAGLPSGSGQVPSSVPLPSGSSAEQSPPHSGSSLVISSSPLRSSLMQSSGGETAIRPPNSVQGSNTPTGIVVPSKATTAPPVVIVSSTSSSAKPSPTITGCPNECRNLDWCRIFCVDSDPDCKPNDCVAECAVWRTVTFFMFKRPVCPCVPKKCDRDGESDSPSDSDRDDPKVKPKPTSRPKEKDPKCKLFGCGCGWMGLSFGPGCPGLEIEITSPCGLFGCNPCVFFGCPGTQPSGIVGYDGYCPGGGCEPCPPELCSRPGCTISGGCGPKPGPAPTKPPNRPDPEDCDDSKRTVITERFVWCTEGFNVSALPSSLRGTSSTMVSSLCLPMIDATVTMCGGAMPGFDTTTTQTGTKTVNSNGPACTRAPLSLDDDEGDNSPNDPFHTSKTFASNTTSMVPSKTSFTLPKITKTSFALPYPSHGPMDKFGHWKVKINQYMFNDYSEVNWKLYDPNGNHAGEHNVHGNGMKEMKDYIQSVNRPLEHMMPFGVDMTVLNPHDVNKCVVHFSIKKDMPGCDFHQGQGCKPQMTTETFTEITPFFVTVCDYECLFKEKKSLLKTSDLWCQDLNEADWEPMANGWKRIFECGWKGF
ncbi:glycoside hydrolase family 18 protein, partial [Bipolaris oryzae ATCC 44560]